MSTRTTMTIGSCSMQQLTLHRAWKCVLEPKAAHGRQEALRQHTMAHRVLGNSS